MRCLCPLALLALLTGCDAPAPRDPSQWPVTTLELEQNAPTDDPAEARYRRYCLACHGNEGTGNGGRTGADFTRAGGALVRDDETLLRSVRDGTTGATGTMPPHRALLSDEEIRAVLVYVRARYAPAPSVPTPQPEP